MIGADVEALLRLAMQFERSAQRLRAVSGQVSSSVHGSVWVGPVSIRFRSTWDSEHSVRLKGAATALESSAKALRQNAAEQEAASASGAGGTVSSVQSGAGTERSGHTGFDWDAATAAGFIHGMADLATEGGKSPGAFRALGPGLALIGAIGGGAQAMEGLATDDAGRVVGGAADVVLGGASIIPPVAVLAGTIGIAKTFVDATIPYSAQSQSELLAWKADQMFGKPTSDLTPDQASDLNDYYNGAQGPGRSGNSILGGARMMSDQMDKTYDDAVEKATQTAQPAINWVGDLTGWF